MKQIFGLVLIIGLAQASNFLINGDFEQPLDIGWQDTIVLGGYIDRSTIYEPDPDYEVMLYKSGSDGYISLFQTASIPSTNLDFSCRTKLYAYRNTPGDWAGSGIIVTYLDDLENQLGETRICYYTADCPWTNSPYLHLIVVTDNDWHDYAFNIDEELTNLSGVNAAEIAKIRVAVFDTTQFCDS